MNVAVDDIVEAIARQCGMEMEVWIINQKVIISVYAVFCNIFHKFRYKYSVCQNHCRHSVIWEI